MNTITEKQIRFIASLARKTGAYETTDGMAVNMRVYPKLSLELALDGRVSKREASQIISVLLEAPQYEGETSNEATAKQIAYIEALAKKAGRSVEIKEDMTKKEASALINELKSINA